MTDRSLPRLVDAGDSVLIAELESRLDLAINRRAAALGEHVWRLRLSGVTDVVVTANAVALHFDPLVADRFAMETALTESVETRPSGTEAARLHRVSVRYGGSDGPDLTSLADTLGISSEEVVRRHVDVTYRVFMLGFMPGFAYLGVLDARLQVPRRSEPRLQVPAGSVAIAGPHTAIYPLETPGGWHIIGRTAFRPFDATREPAALFRVGDMVAFTDAGR